MELTKGRHEIELERANSKSHGHLTKKKLKTYWTLAARTFIESNNIGRTEGIEYGRR